MTRFSPIPRLMFALAVALTGSIVQAQLVLNVNSSTEMMWFTGSTTGTPTVIDIDTVWRTGSGSAVGPIDINGTLSSDAAVLVTTGQFLNTNDSGLVEIDLTFLSAISSTLTGTGAGNAVSFSSLSATAKSNLASATSLPLASGSGFAAITVSAVPEPSAYAAIFGSMALAATMLRRRRKRQIVA